jgi:hypothetical protein
LLFTIVDAHEGSAIDQRPRLRTPYGGTNRIGSRAICVVVSQWNNFELVKLAENLD